MGDLSNVTSWVYYVFRGIQTNISEVEGKHTDH